MVFVWLMLAAVVGIAFTFFAQVNTASVSLVLPVEPLGLENIYISTSTWELIALVFVFGIALTALVAVFGGIMRGSEAGKLKSELGACQQKSKKLAERVQQLEAELAQSKVEAEVVIPDSKPGEEPKPD
jgi:uncharacterized protein YlxW (UPF0749 family)